MAYAAVISLKHTIRRLKNPTNPQITKSAYEELESLGDLLERLDDRSYRCIDRSVIDALDSKIIETVCKLEYVLESYALNHSLPPSESLGDPAIPLVDEKGVEQEMHSFLKIVKQFKWIYHRVLERRLPREEEDDVAVSPMDDFGGNKSATVGLSDQSEKIINDLLDRQSGFKIVSLVGMAGIGKTHLARDIYQHPLIVQHFNFRVWVSVGPKDQIVNALVDIVAQIERKPRNLYVRESVSKLIGLLLNSMNGRRYLIILDDIWSTQVLDFLVKCDPNQGTGRFLLTTRLHEAAKHLSSRTHQIRFLNNDESWNLLWQIVFAHNSSLPSQLEKAGRKIAEDCEGLPLLILAVADILCGLEKTEEYWKKVADRKTTTFTDAYDKIFKVLYSSYEYLPQHLKACFLYMGVFPQSSEIRVPKLLHLWTIEDFLEQKGFQTLEDFTMECLKGLVSKSLAIICKQSYNYRIKSSKLHSAYWHLCVKEARKNKFLLVLKNLTDGSKDYIESQRRLSVQNNILFAIKEVYDSMEATSTARSLLCTGQDHQYPVPICFNLMLLKVLDTLPIRLYEFPTEVVRLLELRYLAITHNGKLPSSISKLRKLQCLIVRRYHNIRLLRDSTRLPKEICNIQQVRSTKFLRDSTCLPNEIWDMEELTHLRIMGSNLPDPIYLTELPNLLTLYVNAHSCTMRIFRSIPYLKKLGIKIELQPDPVEAFKCFKHIRILRGLKSLKCVVANPRLRCQVVAPPYHLLNLPKSLKKLSLNGLGYSWNYMSVIGWLPKLEMLKLRCLAFQGPKWKTKAEEFQSLECLLLEDVDLVHWTIDNVKCFTRLQCLIIRHCYKLKEIPQGIGAIPTLETIEVVDCSPSVVASALQIQEDRNSCIQVVINSSWSLR